MDYFDMDEKKSKEARAKEKFEEYSEKQMRISKKVLLCVFSPMGGFFIGFGLVLCLVLESYEFLVFIVMGAFFLLLGVIFYLVLPKKMNYETYKRRVNRYGMGAYSIVELDAKIANLEEDNEELKRNIKELEYKIRELERKNNQFNWNSEPFNSSYGELCTRSFFYYLQVKSTEI